MNLIKIYNLEKNNFSIFFLLLLITILVRFPWFFPSVINWDESTYILMGQSVLDGNLPYIGFWEMKPPLAHFFYGTFIGLFGKSIISIRFAGALCISIISFFTYLIGKKICNFNVGIYSSILFIFSTIYIPGGQSTMTEFVALVPLIGLVYFLINKENLTTKDFFISGILIAIASMIRTNLIFVAIPLGLFFLIILKNKKLLEIIKCNFFYVFGFFLIIFFTFVPYLTIGSKEVWLNNVILTPIKYSSSQLSILESLTHYIFFLLRIFVNFDSNSLINFFLWIISILGIIFISINWKKFLIIKEKAFLIILIFFFSILFSILKSGTGHPHYLIQIFPLLSIISIFFLNYALENKKKIILIATIFSISIFSIPVVKGYIPLTKNFFLNKKLESDPIIEIKKFMEKENKNNESVYFLTDHIIHWFTNTKPLTRAISHPSNIAKEFLLNEIVGEKTSSKREMAKILNKKPKYIVKKKKVFYLENRVAANSLLEETLYTEYEIIKKIQGRLIYKKHNNQLIKKGYSMHYSLGNIMLLEEKNYIAIRQYQKALKLKFDIPEVHNNFAIALIKIGKYNEALEHLNIALKLRPDYPDAKKNLGIVKEFLNKN